jgi:hypothetical protein
MSTQMKRVADDIIEALSKSGDDVAKKVTLHLRKHKRKLDDVGAQTRRTDRAMAHRTPNRRTDRPETMTVDVRAFRRNPRHDPNEFDRQFNEQMDALENSTVADWLRRRSAYSDGGRPSASNAAQQAARDRARNDLFRELRSRDVSRQDANDAVDAWMSTQAATHRLDGIAGGDVTDISGLGDSRVNSSLGSQWQSRVESIDAAVADFIAANPTADLSQVFMNMNFV